MRSALEIRVEATALSWTEALPDAEAIARRAATAALAETGAGRGDDSGDSNDDDNNDDDRAVELGVRLAGDDELRALNRDWRGVDRPTNVLAFAGVGAASALPAGVPRLLGDVVLAFETVAREAAAQDKSLGDHLSHLVVHGVLHLLGYDHQCERDAARMEGREQAILSVLGIADPYAFDPHHASEATGCDERR